MIRHRSAPLGTITCDLSVTYLTDTGVRLWIPASLRFDPADPIAATLVMQVAEDRVVEWTFARQLLVDGARGPAGNGDVRVRPSFQNGHRVLAVSLSNPTGHADLELPDDRVAKFVRRTYAAVPAEMESDLVDWDAEFGAILGPHPV